MTERALLRLGAGLVSVAFALLLAMVVDAAVRRAARAKDQAAIDAVGARLTTTDLALSGGARWLRAPSFEEPGAAFSEGPAVPDEDPAGGVMSPPRAVWVEEARRR